MLRRITENRGRKLHEINIYLLVTSFHPSSILLLFLGLVAILAELKFAPALDNDTIAHCAAAVAIVAATSVLIERESTDCVDLMLDIIDVATAFVISATVVALTVSRGLEIIRRLSSHHF